MASSRQLSNLQFLLDRHQLPVGDTEDDEDSEEESEFSADEFVQRALNHADIVTPHRSNTCVNLMQQQTGGGMQ